MSEFKETADNLKSTKPELKNCPFCGSPSRKSLTTGLVSCSSPFCPLNHCQMEERQWQSRPLEDALQRKLEKAVKRLMICRYYVSFYDEHRGMGYVELHELNDVIAELEVRDEGK